MLSKPSVPNFAIIKSWGKSCKLSIKPLVLSQYNLIHQAPFANACSNTEYHDPVGIRKAMDSSTVGCNYKLNSIYFFRLDIEGKILTGR